MTFHIRHVRTRAAALGALAAALLAGGCNGERAFAPGELPPSARTIAGGYTAAELTYFDEIALGGAVPRWNPDTLVHKWRHDVRVAITGDVTAADTALLDTICAEVTAAIGGAVRVVRDTAGGRNYEIAVWPPGSLLNSSQGQGVAFTGASLDASGFIDSTSTSVDGAVDRRRTIRHEFMHALGFYDHAHVTPGTLMNLDASAPPPVFTDLDRAAIQMLYRGEVGARTTRQDALATLRGLRRRP